MISPFLKYNSKSNCAPFITINYDENVNYDAAESAIKKIYSTQTGQNILKSILYVSDPDKQLTIVSDHKIRHGMMNYLNKSQIKRYLVPANSDDEFHKMIINHLSSVNYAGSPSEGVSAVVQFNPNIAFDVDPEGYPKEVQNSELSFINLAHELIHALHSMNGTGLHRDSTPRDVFFKDTGMRKEEERAIGLGHFSMEAITENKIRSENGLPIRKSFFTKSRQPAS